MTLQHPFRKALVAVPFALLCLATAVSASAQGGGGSKAPPPTLQADWPPSVPVPAGTILGTNGNAPSETVLVLVNQGYSSVVRSVTTLYTSNGFTQVPDGTLVFLRPPYRVSVAARSRDHSASQTEVLVGLQTGP